MRVIGLSVSLPLLCISIILLTIILSFFIKKVYIPLIVSGYGAIYCILIIYVFGAGYSSIPFVLISWFFAFLFAVSILWIFIKKIFQSEDFR